MFVYGPSSRTILPYMVCPHGQGGGANFRDFVRTSFKVGPLENLPNCMMRKFKSFM